jgi:ribosome-associated protein
MSFKDLYTEFVFSASRSGGPGGQNVNKVNTKVELRFNVALSQILSDEEKTILQEKLANKLTLDGELIVVSQSERSQIMNKERCIEKFYDMIEKALTPQKPRKATRPTKASKTRRLDGKRIKSQIKMLRKNVGI